jgi:hypothetical protein
VGYKDDTTHKRNPATLTKERKTTAERDLGKDSMGEE